MHYIKLEAIWPLTVVCVLVTSGCGITTLKGPDIAPNQPLPKDLMVNNVENPTIAAITLASYCGNLVEQQPSGTYRPLNIPAYAAGQAPAVTTVAANTPPDYHSILDQGASGDVAAQFGAGSGKFNITAQQRLEVTVAKVSFCNSQAASQDVINKAVAALAPYNVDLNNIWLINTALHTQMGVDVLKSISTTESAAVTPV